MLGLDALQSMLNISNLQLCAYLFTSAVAIVGTAKAKSSSETDNSTVPGVKVVKLEMDPYERVKLSEALRERGKY